MSRMETEMFLSVKVVVFHVSLRQLEHAQNAEMFLSVKVVVFHVSLRQLEHVQNADWNGFVS